MKGKWCGRPGVHGCSYVPGICCRCNQQTLVIGKHQICRACRQSLKLAWRLGERQIEIQKEKARSEYMARIPDAYIAELMGVSVEQIPPEILGLKREQIRLRRLAKQLKQAATAANHEP